MQVKTTTNVEKKVFCKNCKFCGSGTWPWCGKLNLYTGLEDPPNVRKNEKNLEGNCPDYQEDKSLFWKDILRRSSTMLDVIAITVISLGITLGIIVLLLLSCKSFL
jgi:hypothetical protein